MTEKLRVEMEMRKRANVDNYMLQISNHDAEILFLSQNVNYTHTKAGFLEADEPSFDL
jgi:hypothetical protein